MLHSHGSGCRCASDASLSTISTRSVSGHATVASQRRVAPARRSALTPAFCRETVNLPSAPQADTAVSRGLALRRAVACRGCSGAGDDKAGRGVWWAAGAGLLVCGALSAYVPVWSLVRLRVGVRSLTRDAVAERDFFMLRGLRCATD